MKDWLCKPTSLEEAKEIIERAVANDAKLYEKPVNSTDDSRNPHEFRWNLLDSWGVMEGKTYTLKSNNWKGMIEILTIEQVREQFPRPDEKSVKWEGLKPNSIDWLEFAKSIGATHWHENEMKFAKKGDGHSCMMFGDNGWGINEDHVCPSSRPDPWEQYLIDFTPIKDETDGMVGSEMAHTTLDGSGLPPIGAVCLIDLSNLPLAHERFRHHDGMKATIIGHEIIDDTPVAVYSVSISETYKEYHSLVAGRFRPIKSERELWVEDAVKVMEQSMMVNISPKQQCRLYAEQIYDKVVNQK